MIKLIPILLASILLGCTNISQESSDIVSDSASKEFNVLNPEFELDLGIERINKMKYYLVATVTPHKGSYVVSPFSNDSLLLPFSISLPKNSFFKFSAGLTESPKSTEEYDKIIEQKVRYNREKTSFRKLIILKTIEDFEVNGLIEFIYEPSCIPYDVEFKISNDSGKLSVQKKRTLVSKEYKGE